MFHEIIKRDDPLWIFFFEEKNVANETVFEEVSLIATRLRKLPKRVLSFKISDEINKMTIYPGVKSLKEAADYFQQFHLLLQICGELTDNLHQKQRTWYQYYQIFTDGKDAIDLLSKSIRIMLAFSKETPISFEFDLKYLEERIQTSSVLEDSFDSSKRRSLSLLKDLSWRVIEFIEARKVANFEFAIANDNLSITVFEDSTIHIKIGRNIDPKQLDEDERDRIYVKDRSAYQRFHEVTNDLDIYTNVGRYAPGQENLYVIPAGADMKLVFAALRIAKLIDHKEKQALIDELRWMF